MFGIKIISKRKYQHEQHKYENMCSAYEVVSKENQRLRNDIQSLRDQNANLRKTNDRLGEKINGYAGENRKLKDQLKRKQEVKFDKFFTLCLPEHCDTCTHEQEDCKKFYLERKTDVICVCPKPSFRKQ